MLDLCDPILFGDPQKALEVPRKAQQNRQITTATERAKALALPKNQS